MYIFFSVLNQRILFRYKYLCLSTNLKAKNKAFKNIAEVGHFSLPQHFFKVFPIQNFLYCLFRPLQAHLKICLRKTITGMLKLHPLNNLNQASTKTALTSPSTVMLFSSSAMSPKVLSWLVATGQRQHLGSGCRVLICYLNLVKSLN